MIEAKLLDNFQKFFSIEYVTTESQKTKIFEIRYDVYCREFEYEDIGKYPHKQEADEFDDRSFHCLITHNESNTSASCVRLVSPGDNLLPLEKYCSASLDTELIKDLNLIRSSCCEISRLAVSSIFRRRSGEEESRFGNLDFFESEKRTFPLITIATLLGATALSDLTGLNNAFAMMEPFLPRMLNKSGLYFQRIGSNINYHGVRAPYFITTESVLDKMEPNLKVLYYWIRSQLKKNV